MEAQVKVLGGLPVTVAFTIAPADPDVGYFQDGVEDWEIIEIAGRPLRKKESANWIYNRLTANDEQRIIEACSKAIDDFEPDFDEPDFY